MQPSRLRQGVRLLGVFCCFFVFLLCPPTQPVAGQADQAYWISQAQERLRRGDREGALKAFQKATWKKSQDPAIHYNMGVLAESLGREAEAVGYYTAYLRWAPEARDKEAVKKKVFRLCGHLGAQAYQNRQFLRALDWYNKARDLYPSAKTIYFNMSRVHEARGEWRRAADSLKEYYTVCDQPEKEPVKKRIAAYLSRDGEARFRQGDYDGALLSFREAARWDLEDTGLLLRQAQCEEKEGLWKAAKNHYLAYLEVDPMAEDREAILEKVVRLHTRLAKDYLDLGYIGRAQDILDKGLEIDSGNPDVHYLLAKTYLAQRQPEKAVAHLEEILKASPDEGDTRDLVQELVQLCTTLADEAYRAQNYEDALRFLKKTLVWDPDHPLVAYNLARVYERENDWGKAALAYRRYLLLDPDAAERNEVKAKLAYYYSRLGNEHFVRGEYPQAQEAFEQALLVSPEDQALLYNLAMVLLKRGKTTEALHFLERYVKHERDPGEIERVRRQIGALVKLTGEGSRRKRGKSMTSALADLGQEQNGSTNLALAERERGFLLLQSGRWQEALDVYEECLRRFPRVRTEEAFRKEIASAYREISRDALVRGRMIEALDALEAARKWAPTEPFSYLWKGRVYEHKGDAARALRVYRESLRTVEGTEGRQAIRNRIVSILTQQLQAALREEDLHEALKTMDTLEPYLDEAQVRDVHYQRARIEGALGRKEAALVDYGLHVYEASQSLEDPRMRAELMALLQGEPDLVASIDDPSNAYQKAMEAAKRGEHSKALFCFLVSKGAEQTPPDLDAEILHSLEALRMDREALAFLSRKAGGDRPLLLPKTQADAWVRRAESILWEDYQAGQYEKGLERIRNLQSQLPVPEVRLILLQGAFEEMIGRYEDAIHRYVEALQEGGTLPQGEVSPVHQRLCTLLIRKALGAYEEGDYVDCLEWLKQADRTVPGRRDVAFNLGCVYLRLKNLHGALQAFSRYRDLEEEASPRKELTGNAIELIQRQLVRSPVVRYDGEGIAMDLIFERSVSLGYLLAREGQVGVERDREELLDSVLLAPYLELPPGGERDRPFPPFD